jgi:His-Xaa-Ser system radical SAM maturase HxsB
MIDINKTNYQKLAFFRFKKLGKDYLLTNETGDYVFLGQKDFDMYLQGKFDEKSPKYKELCQKDFVKGKINLSEYTEKYKQKNQFLFQSGPNLHIIAVTLRCNHKCIYCQASSVGLKGFQFDMNKETAQKVVDLIFKSPSHFIAIEFQGGEPLFNWPIVKFIIEYVLKKNKQEKRDLELRLVSNFTLMNEERMNYLFKKGVIFCTSLDGPEKLHNKNRIWLTGNSYKQTVKWLKKTLKEYKKYYIYQPGALTTITRFSIPYYKEIIDQYIKLGFDSIFLRPLTPLGMAKKRWEKIGYSPAEFLRFYKKSLDYILFLNLKKRLRFREITATNMAAKILTKQDPNYFELRSPCGAGIGQLLYNYNGDVYTCDEGRMLDEETFKIGNVARGKYEDIVSHPAVKTICLASCLDNVPCDHCVYKPYCGSCPIVNYAESGNIFSQLPNNSRCQINQGIFDFLFQKIQENDKIKTILKKWATSRYQFSNTQKYVRNI